MTAAQKDTVVYIQDSQTQAEKRHGLNLMISMTSQHKDSSGKIQLHKSVHAVAEIFVTTGQTRLLNADQLMQFIEAYPHDDMSQDMKRELLIQLSDGVFKETPVQRSQKVTSRYDKNFEEQETDNEQGTQPDRQPRSEVETSKPVSAEQFRSMLDDCIYGTDSDLNPEKESSQQEQVLQIYMKNIEKFRSRHVTSMALQLLYPKDNIENQARAIKTIFQSIDVKLQGLIQVPLASTAIDQRHLAENQASLALACLIRHIYGQGTTAITKQEQAIQTLCASYKQGIKDPLTFHKNVMTEWTVYDSVWQYFSTPSNKRLTERDKCELLLKYVAKEDSAFAVQQQRELQKKGSTYTLEELLRALEEQHRLLESLQIESETSSPAKSGKGGGTNLADKKVQPSANPAIQQQLKCSICGNEHDVSKCPKEIDRLKKEAQRRGEKLPGSDKSTKRDSQKEDQQSTHEMREGCFMCFALGKPFWGHHPPAKCFFKEKFDQRMEDPAQRTKLIEKMAAQPPSARGNRTSERSNVPSQQSRNPQGERPTQSRQGSMSSDQQMQQAQMQHMSAMSREYNYPVGQQYYMPQQPASVQSDYVSPWQLHNSAQNSSQFFQPQGQQTMQRTAQVSQTIGPGFGGEAPQIQYLHHPPGPNPMVLQVSPQSQVFRQVDTRNVSEQGMMSIGAQAGNTPQSPDRYHGSDSSSANTAVRVQPSRGAALLTQSLGNYLTLSPYSQGEGQQRGGQNAVVTQGSHFAMTAVSVNATAQVANSPKPTMESFEQLPMWILQRFAMANVDPSAENSSLHLTETKKGAKHIVEERVLAGEELIHPTITGVFGHVAGQGQCFIDTRNILNGVDECPKVTRNKIINDLVLNRHEVIGWETAENLLKFEYNVDFSDPGEIREFVSQYVDGDFQSGIIELLYAAKCDKSHYIVVSTVYGETTCAVTAIFPCYERCANNLKFLKAGVITLEELATPLMLFSHGGLINPHVLGSNLTHFAPIHIKTAMETEDLLNQCLIVLEISPECHKESSNLLNSLEVDEKTLEKILEDSSDNRINQLPTKLEQMILRREQRLVLYILCIWTDEFDVSLGRQIIAEEKLQLKRLKYAWQSWKHLHMLSKSACALAKRIKSHAQCQMVRLWFATWKQSRDTKKRVKMLLCMNTVQTVVNATMIVKLFNAWKSCQQGISRSEQSHKCHLLPEIMLRLSMRLMDRTFHMWSQKAQFDLELKKQSTQTPELKVVSIPRRRLLTETNQVSERSSIQGLQEGNLNLTQSFLSPSTNARVQKSISYVRAGALENEKTVALLRGVLHGWYAISRSNSINRYRNIQLQSFTIGVLQQQAECSPRRAFRLLLNSYFDQYVIKRYLQFWINHYEMTHGITRSEMNNLFKKHIAKRISRRHLWSWQSVLIRKNRNVQAFQICERTYKIHLLESTFAVWNKLVDMKLPCVEKFVRSSQITLRTKLFHKWKNSSFEQKSLLQKIRSLMRKCLFNWFQFAWEKQKPTSAEQFRQSSRCADLQHALRELLKKLRLNRLSPSVWLLLRRRGRLRNKNRDRAAAQQDEQCSNQFQVVAYEVQAHKTERKQLQDEHETHVLGQIASEAQDLGYLQEISRRVPILVCKEIANGWPPVTGHELSYMCSMVFTVIFIWWIVPILFVCAQTGGVKSLKMFPTTLTKCSAQTEARVAMPASTKIITANEVRDNFVTRRSLFDTGTDAYLRQDESLMYPLFPSSTVIHTAGPDQLRASHSGLLHLIVKDDKGNLHQLQLENALVVPNLSQNLTSHKQFVESGHMVFFHESQAGIVLNKKPKFSSSDVVIPFTMGENGLYYLEEYLPEARAVAMVAQRMQKLTNTELAHISLCHVCPSLMRHLNKETNLPKLQGLNDFRCHCCVEAKLKHAPKPPRSMRVITMPGQLISCDIVGPFRIKSIHGKTYGLVFIDHCTNTPFNYAMRSKDEFPQYLQQFLIDFREMFKDYKVCEIQVLRSDNASELNSTEVQKTLREHGIKHQLSCPYQQFQNGTAEKCIGDLWMMTKISLLFSGVPRYLWDEAWFNAAYVKRHLPTTANEEFKSPLHMITGDRVNINHIHPFGSLLYIVREKSNIPDPKFDPRAQATVYLGHGYHEGRKCVKGYSFNFGKKGLGQIMYSTNVYSDPTYFPFRKKGEERVTTLSGGIFMSGKDKESLEQEIPLPPEVQEWADYAEKYYDFPESEDQQENVHSSEVSDKQITKDASTPLENQIVGYNEAQDRYAVRSAGEITYVDSSELFQKVADGEKVFVEGVQGSIPGFSISYQEDEDMFIKKDGNMYVEQITVQEFKQKLDDIYRTTESPTQFYSIHDNIKEIIMNNLIREDEEKMRSKDVWKNQTTYDRSFTLPDVLEHDKHPEEVHAYAARTAPNVFGSDELTLAQAKNLTHEWPLWLEAVKIELTSLIITNEVFEPIDWKDVPEEKKGKIFNLLILLKRKRDQVGEITKHKARLVMDGSRAQIGVDVFDTYAPVIDYSTVRLLISLAFGNHWQMFHWDISVAFTNAKAEEETYVRFPKSFPEGLFHGYKGGTIARLKRNLYGSKSAPKLWYKCLHEVLIELGFKSVAGHPCLFIRITNVAGKLTIVVMGIFVDDLLVTGNSVEEIAAIQEKMKSKFVLTDQGELEYYLGVEVSKIDESTLLLHQTGYAKKILERFRMTDCNAVKTPLPRDLNLSLMDSPDEVDPILQSEYRAIIGSLMYLYQWTRPDLGFAVTFLSRYLHRPGEKHLQAAKHVLRYLKGTVGLGIRYTRDVRRLWARDQQLNVLYALSDSDFAGCKDTSRSTSGYMILMNGGVVAYYSGRQSTVALCTAMAETIALTKLVVKVKHMRAILFDLQCQQKQKTLVNSTCVWVDNAAAIAVATGNDFTHETVKHVTVKVRFLQECVQRGIIMIAYIKTCRNISDIMTKQSAGPQFAQHRDYSLGIIDAITTVIAACARVWRRLRFRV